MTEETRIIINVLLKHLEGNKDNIIIDADTHITDLEALTGEIRNKYNDTPN